MRKQLVLILAILAFGLVGCGQKTDVAAEANKDASATVATQEQSAKPAEAAATVEQVKPADVAVPVDGEKKQNPEDNTGNAEQD